MYTASYVCINKVWYTWLNYRTVPLQARLKFDKAEAIYTKLVDMKDFDPTLVSHLIHTWESIINPLPHLLPHFFLAAGKRVN